MGILSLSVEPARCHQEAICLLLEGNLLLQKAATASNPILEITEEEGVWTFKTSTALKTMEMIFILNEPFDESTPDGREVTTVVTFENSRFITVQTAKNKEEKSTKSTRKMVSPDEMIHTITVEGSDIVCVQNFKRI